MRKGNDLDTSNSDCSVDHASRRLALGPLSRAGTYSLSVPKLVLGPDGPVHKTTAYNPMGEQAACVARQYFYAENTAAYTGEVFGRPDKVRLLGWFPRQRSPLKYPGIHLSGRPFNRLRGRIACARRDHISMVKLPATGTDGFALGGSVFRHGALSAEASTGR